MTGGALRDYRDLDHVRPAVVAIGVVGEIDLVSAPGLAAILGRLIDREPGSVALNLADVTFMGAPGLGVIATTSRRLDPLGHRLFIHSPSDAVTRLLDITGLSEFVSIEYPESPDRLGREQSAGSKEIAAPPAKHQGLADRS